MSESLSDLYRLPNIQEYADLNLLSLSEMCASLEEQIYTLAMSLPEKDRQIIHAYISARNDLEVESVKTALRWGKQHYR